MCGIVGTIGTYVDRSEIEKMLTCLAHRGPENEGVWISPRHTVGLGHRRLAIIDISPSGNQPMQFSKGRYTITFNGEIYNYQELKKDLEVLGCNFISSSDTEVLLAAYATWGKECLKKLNGMFSFAIWDDQEEELFAARDRLGEKPFKYYYDVDRFIFASEIKAILTYQNIPRDIDWQSIDSALSLRFCPAPHTGFNSIQKLPAGHYIVWKNNKITINRYWSLEDTSIEDYSIADWKKRLWELFLDSVKRRMISDVSVGALLSGGIDSTSVVAAMSEVCNKQIETFVISMDGESDDQRYAREASMVYGTNHHEIAITEIDYARALENVASAYDEPFFDQSALPSLLISEYIKKYVTVILTGDGGDELFGGYPNYSFVRFLQLYQRIPAFIRSRIPHVLFFSKTKQYYGEVISQDFFNAYTEYYAIWKTSLPLSKKYITKSDLYLPEFKKRIEVEHVAKKMKGWFGTNPDKCNAAMRADILSRLADGYLTKVDIAMMTHAVEARPPFLDHRLVEMSQKIPSSLKINHNKTKYLWKKTVQDKIPTSIIMRPKIGFSIPLDAVLKTRLKEYVESTILQKNALISSYFSSVVVKKMWKDHMENKADYSNHIWSILMLELWLKKYTN